MENLWPEIGEITKKRTPISILNEQGSVLSDMTGGVIVGEPKRNKGLEVRLAGTYEKLSGNIFVFNFIIRAPILEYAYKLFTIAYDIFLYPVYFVNLDVDIENELKRIITSEIVANNEKEYMRLLKMIFFSGKSKKIMSSILSQIE